MNTITFAHNDKYLLEDLEFHLPSFLNDELRPQCYSKVTDLEVSFAYSPEPQPFNEINKLRFKPIKVGETWAKENFACAWFHLMGRLKLKGNIKDYYLGFSNGGEGLLVDQKGHALKGFTAGSPVFGAYDYNVEKWLYPLEGLLWEDGAIDLYIDGASNALLGGFVPDQGRLNKAGIYLVDANKRKAFADFDVLLSSARALPEGDPRKEALGSGLREIMDLFIYQDPQAKEKEDVIAKRLFALKGNDGAKAQAVGGAHLDLGWLWPIRESKRKALRTLANVIYLIKKYPSFHFSVSQPQMLDWIKKSDPVLFQEIKDAVRAGRIEIVGGGYVESDTNLPSGESLVRQELYGQKFIKEEFGDYTSIAWLPDSFGYSAALPQILSLSNQKYFMTIKLTWNTRTIFPYHAFKWVGLDHSEVLAYIPPEGTYNSLVNPEALLAGEKNLFATDPKDEFLVVYGIGDGGGGPSSAMVERCLLEKDIPYLPKVTMGTALSFYQNLEKKSLPTYDGEMYLEKHRGTYTSQSNNKYFNRRFEEKAFSLEALLSSHEKEDPKGEMGVLWKEALLYQFHDILPGSAIKRVYDETAAAYQKLDEALEKKAQEEGCSFLPAEGDSLLNPLHRPVRKLQKTGDGYQYFAGSSSLIKPVILNKKKEIAPRVLFQNQFYSLKFTPDYSSFSLALSDGTIIGKENNRLRLYIDRGDAWDFEDDYRNQPEIYPTLQKTTFYSYGPLEEIVQEYRFHSSKLIQRILLLADDPIIRISHDVEWKDSGYMLRSESVPSFFPPLVHSGIQFGHLDRSTGEDTEHEKAQFEMCCGKYFDISNPRFGLSILNNAKNGFMAKRGILSLNLFRATTYPGVDAELHPLHYEYAFYPHSGDFDPIQSLDQADDFNARPCFGQKDFEVPYFTNQAIRLSCYKPAYDGNGYILRAYEAAGKENTTELILPSDLMVSEEENLLEDPLGGSFVDKELVFRPFQIRTFRLKRK